METTNLSSRRTFDSWTEPSEHVPAQTFLVHIMRYLKNVYNHEMFCETSRHIYFFNEGTSVVDVFIAKM